MQRLIRTGRSRPIRRGFTLLEIVLGMAIFFGSLAIFSQILWNGSRAAVQGQLRSQALVRCEAKLGEVVAGAVPFQSQPNQSYSSDPEDQGWNWSVEIEPTNHPNLNAVVVTVGHTGNSDLANASVQLRRWMRDPEQMALVAHEAALQDQENKDKAEEAKRQAETDAANNKKAQGSGATGGQGKGGVGTNNGGDKKGGGGSPKGGGGGGGGGKGGGGKGGGGLPPGLPPGFPPDFPFDLIPPGGFPPGLFPPGFIPPGGTPKGR